ncbi:MULTISPECIES: hypothetical protein [Pseudomonas]|uniref:Peptidase inhibitor I78 family protein n=2 Tax=Pseudomonas TaxID=286 RepID=A0A5B2UFL6_9PSED|nr:MULTISPECIES: hypothetical protein [Pseudomonas]KAA2225443.1 hypothetical protein F1720_28045 [Pseudomonas brenneri]KAB0497773.1 hypothetical protein F7R09_09680 [Pseudomonas vancouverensis]TDB66500.1 hypothetical protein EIY72_06450 [Pseudomonas vancouverensis]SDV16024.1 hypothetical protein SAMN05216558_5254 [Pseudomonas vancouverensis]
MTTDLQQHLDTAKQYIGNQYTEELRAELANKTGLAVRPRGVGFIMTKDYNPARINLLVENDIITHVTMGN